MGERIAYKRVSTTDQNTARQLEGQAFKRIFEDRASGKNLERPEFAKMMDYLRPGDTLYVHSMDRLARSLPDLLKTVKELTERGVEIKFVKENLDFKPQGSGDPMQEAMAKLTLSIFGAFAEFLLAMNREQQREGIAAAKARGGVYKGGKPKFKLADLATQARRRLAAGETLVAIAKSLGCTRQTLYKAMKSHPELAKEEG